MFLFFGVEGLHVFSGFVECLLLWMVWGGYLMIRYLTVLVDLILLGSM